MTDISRRSPSGPSHRASHQAPTGLDPAASVSIAARQRFRDINWLRFLLPGPVIIDESGAAYLRRTRISYSFDVALCVLCAGCGFACAAFGFPWLAAIFGALGWAWGLLHMSWVRWLSASWRDMNAGWQEANRVNIELAQGMEARRDETGTGSVGDESPTPEGGAP